MLSFNIKLNYQKWQGYFRTGTLFLDYFDVLNIQILLLNKLKDTAKKHRKGKEIHNALSLVLIV